MRLLDGAPQVILARILLALCENFAFMMDHIIFIGFRSGEHTGQSISLDREKPTDVK